VKKIMQSKTLALILAGIFIILTALFVWFFQDWVRSAIVVPVYYLFWLISKILNSVDQQILWTILFMLALGAIWQALIARSRVKATPLETEGKSRGQGRVIYWLIYVNLMLKGVYNRSYFSEELKRLILSVMALHERQLPIEIEKRIVSGDLVVPPQIVALYKNPGRRIQAAFPQRVTEVIDSWIHPERRENRPEKIQDLQAVIDFIEEQMERK
jgi:hypothetical protein